MTSTNIYYDLEISNNTNQTINESKFSEQRVESVVNIGNQYNIVVNRFNVDTSALPLIFFKDFNLSFVILINYNGETRGSQVLLPEEQDNISLFKNDDPIYNYQFICKCINYTIEFIYSLFGFPIIDLPKITFDLRTYLFKIIYPDNPIFDYDNVNTFELLFSSPLYNLFNFFDSTLISSEYNSQPYNFFQFIFKRDLIFGTNKRININGSTYWVLEQEKQGLNFLNLSYTKVTLSAFNIHNRQEGFATINSTGKPITFPFLTDIEPLETELSNNRSYLSYLPTGEFKKINIVDNKDIRNLAFSVLFQNLISNFSESSELLERSTSTYDIPLLPYRNHSIGILFQKKV